MSIDFILSTAKKYGDKKLAGFKRGTISKIFDSLDLPAPDNGEYFSSTDSGYLVFLSRYGAVIRIRRPMPVIGNEPLTIEEEQSASLLQPLLRRQVGPLSIEIMPGVELTTISEYCDDLKYEVEGQGYKFSDCAPRNVGVLPNDAPVIIDIGAVHKLRHACLSIKPATQQKALYHDLIAKCETAWPEGQKFASDRPAQSMWKAFETARKDGFLRAEWDIDDIGQQTGCVALSPQYIPEAARLYNQRLG